MKKTFSGLLTILFGLLVAANAQDGTNLALNKPATSNGSYAVWCGPGMAVDGNFSTLWSAPSGAPPSFWLKVDLEAEYTPDRIVLTGPSTPQWNASYYNDYVLEYSTDNVNWHLIQGGTLYDDPTDYPGDLIDNVDDITLSGCISMRYVRVTMPSGTHWPHLVELEVIELGPQNSPPTVSAGENLSISSADQMSTVIEGSASDPNGDELSYLWLEGENELTDWLPVGENGEAYLSLYVVPYFSIGQHVLTLKVSDGTVYSIDELILSLNNSAPIAAPTGGGIYQIANPINLGGHVSDFDGDQITYEWIENGNILFVGQVLAEAGGVPIELPQYKINFLPVGVHSIMLRLNDGWNEPVAAEINVEVIDTTAPTLAPEPNVTILWPPNHLMVDIEIVANAMDSSGQVTLSAIISSNEPILSTGDGDTAPDWTAPVIDQTTGVISFQLRAERSGGGNGRVYSVVITASDESGNNSTAFIEIKVPHNKINR